VNASNSSVLAVDLLWITSAHVEWRSPVSRRPWCDKCVEESTKRSSIPGYSLVNGAIQIIWLRLQVADRDLQAQKATLHPEQKAVTENREITPYAQGHPDVDR